MTENNLNLILLLAGFTQIQCTSNDNVLLGFPILGRGMLISVVGVRVGFDNARNVRVTSRRAESSHVSVHTFGSICQFKPY